MKPPFRYKHGTTARHSRRGLNVARRRDPVPAVEECEASPYDWEDSCEGITEGYREDCNLGLWKCVDCRWNEIDPSVMSHKEAWLYD